ncbi:MAG: endolytic transglycosylase MltG, partial [Candidatus Methylomirabilis sp.]|nr:endolytic transglycosylase MltG [Deltaproteobacteria bacterium]
ARRADALGLSQREAVTLASIIEKETGVASERPRISAVFHNRLKKNMRLQSDPTVIYGLPAFDGNLRRKDLRTPTAYNTYVIAGLPPGPIASPGEESLRAALWPAEDRALYFVAKGDGSHVFSESLDAHNRAVSRYQRGGG